MKMAFKILTFFTIYSQSLNRSINSYLVYFQKNTQAFKDNSQTNLVSWTSSEVWSFWGSSL